MNVLVYGLMLPIVWTVSMSYCRTDAIQYAIIHAQGSGGLGGESQFFSRGGLVFPPLGGVPKTLAWGGDGGGKGQKNPDFAWGGILSPPPQWACMLCIHKATKTLAGVSLWALQLTSSTKPSLPPQNLLAVAALVSEHWPTVWWWVRIYEQCDLHGNKKSPYFVQVYLKQHLSYSN